MTQPRLLGGRYELDGVVGRGGMAEVYRARDLRLDRVVAVKTLREDLARDQTFQARFRREAQSAASLNHPSIVAVYDTGEDQVGSAAVPFIVMEYVDGRTIRDLLRDDRRLLPERALEITDGVLRALDYSHRNGIVHRDIKPGNVMLNRNGEIKVMDFGIARAVSDSQATMTQTAQVIGTAQYLSPEQARGERVDSRSDLYSVGCLLYELLTGRPPFTGDSPVAIAYQHVRENPVPPSRVDPELPAWADPIVLKAMAKDPADRYQSAAEMRTDIQRALGGYPIAAQLPAPGYDPGQGTRRMDAMANSRTQMQRPAGAIPPYEYATGYGEDGGPGPRDYRAKRRPVWPWIAALIALIVIVGGIFAYKTISGGSSGVAVPDVTGQSLTSAENAITRAGLVPRLVSQNSTTGPYNQVISETPQPGNNVAKGTQISLVYYPQPGTKNLPSVSGMTSSEAISFLNGKGWTNVITSGTQVASLTVPGGSVVNTNPAAGTPVPFTAQVTLNVSGGGVKMPDLVGMSAQQAETALTTRNLTYNAITAQGPSGFLPGTVFSTNPAAGTVILPTQVVTLNITPNTPSSSPSSSQSSSPTSPPPTSPSTSPG